MKITATLIALCFTIYFVQAQERRMKEKEVPASIPQLLKTNYPSLSELKYYKVKEDDTDLIEATFKSGDDEYALKFFTNGNIAEIERELEYDKLPAEIRARIEQELKTKFISYRVTKTEEINPSTDLKYELKVKGRMTEGKSVRFAEAYFDRHGTLTEIEVIPLKSIPSAF